MPQYIQPTLTLKSSSHTVNRLPGPGSVSLTLQIPDQISVDQIEAQTVTTSTTQDRIVDGFKLGGATKTPGTVGCYMYMKNNDTTAGNNILVGIVSNSRIHVAVADDETTISGTNNPLAPHVDTEDAPLAALEDGDGTAFDNTNPSTGDSRLQVTNNQTLRTFTLLPGEFAFFPFDYTGDIYVQAAQNTPQLEYWVFDRG
tara:strand:- start:67 stop:666 length:600 start_codon:yes stop_codon:yes gene_type:complete